MVVAYHQNLSYSATIDRQRLRLPGKARLAVWTIVNVEHWRLDGPMPRTVLPPPMGAPRLPDIANWSWHEYGMRNGFWRFVELFDRLGVRPTLAINGSVCDGYPRVAEAAASRGWEFMGHGFDQQPMHNLQDEAEVIERTMAAIERVTGKPPRGWESPGLTQTHRTATALKQAGIDYTADLILDDQPCWLNTEAGRLVALPYTVELNDVVITAVQQHRSDELLRRGIDQFERLYAEGEACARIMAISVHPYLTGVPHRIGYLERLYEHLKAQPDVIFLTGAELTDWWLAEMARSSSPLPA